MVEDAILDEFEAELRSYKSVLAVAEAALELVRIGTPSGDHIQDDTSEFLRAALNVHKAIRSAQFGMPALPGAVHLLCVARFEAFIRSEIEDLALRASQNVAKFSHLPRAMQQNLRELAADVLADPRKHRMEGSVSDIAATLAKNLADTSAPGEINHKCVSITYQNMSSEMVHNLFLRLDCKDVWPRIGSESDVQLHLQTFQKEQAESTAKHLLNKAIEDRNRVAHSAGSTTWPSIGDAQQLIDFMICLGRALKQRAAQVQK
jgi:hypothetical protein